MMVIVDVELLLNTGRMLSSNSKLRTLDFPADVSPEIKRVKKFVVSDFEFIVPLSFILIYYYETTELFNFLKIRNLH
jgi:hypothetical protein